MAKKKLSVLIENLPNEFIKIWIDNRKQLMSEISSIDGIYLVDDLSPISCLMVHCDPRYDKQELLHVHLTGAELIAPGLELLVHAAKFGVGSLAHHKLPAELSHGETGSRYRFHQ